MTELNRTFFRSIAFDNQTFYFARFEIVFVSLISFDGRTSSNSIEFFPSIEFENRTFDVIHRDDSVEITNK